MMLPMRAPPPGGHPREEHVHPVPSPPRTRNCTPVKLTCVELDLNLKQLFAIFLFTFGFLLNHKDEV